MFQNAFTSTTVSLSVQIFLSSLIEHYRPATTEDPKLNALDALDSKIMAFSTELDPMEDPARWLNVNLQNIFFYELPTEVEHILESFIINAPYPVSS